MRRSLQNIIGHYLPCRPVLLLGCLVVAFLLSSCKDDGGEDGQVRVIFTTLLPKNLSDSTQTTRAIATNESTINTLSYFLFDADGVNIGSTFVPTPVIQEGGKYNAEIATRENDRTEIYVIANLDEATYNSIINQQQADALVANADLNNTGTNEAYLFGKQGPVLISKVHHFFTLELDRIYAKLDFDIKVSDAMKDRMKITEVKLHNVPTSTYISDANIVSVSGSPSTVSSALSPSYLTSSWTSDIPLTVTGGNTCTATYYTYENIVGNPKGTVTKATDRNKDNAPDHATYITIKAEYYDRPMTGDGAKAVQHSTYRAYVGGKDFTETTSSYADFNIYRNHHYTYKVNINGTGWNDVRVEFTSDAAVGAWTGYIGQWEKDSNEHNVSGN